jgi:hypothetical protein
VIQERLPNNSLEPTRRAGAKFVEDCLQKYAGGTTFAHLSLEFSLSCRRVPDSRHL